MALFRTAAFDRECDRSAPPAGPCAGLLLAALCLALSSAPPARAADWPMAGYDAQRTAASPERLPADLRLRWAVQLPKLNPAWPDQPRMRSDSVYHPIVVGPRALVASPLDDSVAGYDLATGAERWRFFAAGPVRFPPAADAAGRVFFGSDDGYLYALAAGDGSLLWKHKGAPKTRLVLGNGRLIDTWPVRGAPVVADGRDGRPVVYFAAGIWPFMGVFLHCVDAATGRAVWTNSGDGAAYLTQPHNAPSFAGIAPQGPLAVSGDRLLIPNGRAVPACYDRHTGRFRFFQLPTRAGGDHVVASRELLFNDGVAYGLTDGKPVASVDGATAPPVVCGDEAYAPTRDGVARYNLTAPARRTAKVFIGPPKQFLAEPLVGLPGTEVVIRAGNRLYAGGKGFVAAINLPLNDDPTPAWRVPIDGTAAGMAAGNGCLLVVTEDGRIGCFGAGQGAVMTVSTPPAPATSAAAPPDVPEQVKAILADARPDGGYALALGASGEGLVRELAGRGKMHVVVLEPDAARADRLRRDLRRDGLYGERVAVLDGDVTTAALPPYFASVIVAADPIDATAAPAQVAALYKSLHPYHGRAYLPADDRGRKALADWAANTDAGHAAVAALDAAPGVARLARSGGLTGAGNWSHEHADAANTRVSRDTIVKAPLGLLWYGGSSHDGVLPRHGHGPQPQVIDGRVIVEGPDLMRAMDIYTGRVLWEADLPGVGSYYDNTAHQAGANGAGSNYVSTPDGIYVALGRTGVQLDPRTGRKVATFDLPRDASVAALGPDAVWSYINVFGDYLVAGAAPPDKAKSTSRKTAAARDTDDKDDDKADADDADDDHAKPAKRPAVVTNPRTVGSRLLIMMDRRSGQVLWSVRATSEFRHNAICIGGGRLYAIDRPQTTAKGALSFLKKGDAGDKSDAAARPKLHAFDLATGRELWAASDAVFGTWLSYSAQYDVLMESGRKARDTLKDEPAGMRAYQAKTGTVLWVDPAATGPAMIRGRTVLKEKSAADLLTGEPVTRADPITGIEAEWTWTRMYGCNTPAGSEHLLTFRSGAAGFYDLCRLGGTGNFGGFRSSCTNNLIVAGGVLCAPDYTRTCTCAYPLQTSLALVPDADADAEMWTFLGATGTPKGPKAPLKAPIRRLGINLGAPGDRLADDGTPWLEHPSTGGPSPKVDVTTDPDKPEFARRHASAVAGDKPWVTASGARGLRSLKVALNNDPESPQTYTVRLYFAQPGPPEAPAGATDVALQGRTVERALDVPARAGGPDRSLVREYRGVAAAEDLTVELKPTTPAGVPLLCGVELVAEERP